MSNRKSSNNHIVDTNKKVSSIDWLVSQILVEYDTYLNEEGDLVDKPIKQFFNSYKDFVNLIEYVNKAKEMHKQEIKQSWNHGFDWGMMEQSLAEQGLESTLIDSEHYYTETFGK